MAATYDAIVVGGGHNGLVAAAYLARSGARTVVLEGRHKTGGAATTEAPWPDAPEFSVTRLSYVMSLMPPTIINDLDLDRHGYKIYPMGPYYQAFPEGGSIKIYADDARRNHDEMSKWSKKDADAMPRVGRLAGRPGRRARPAAAHRPARDRVPQAARPGRDAAAGLAAPRPGRAHDRGRDPADDDEHRRPARRLVRVAAGQGRARGQRRDRHLGRALRAGHRLRDGAPLDRRRRRRSPGQLGVPGGRHGRGLGRDRAGRPQPRRRDPHRRAGGARHRRGRPGRGRGAGQRRGDPGPGRGVHAAPAHRVPRARRARTTCPPTSSPTSSTGRPAAAS